MRNSTDILSFFLTISKQAACGIFCLVKQRYKNDKMNEPIVEHCAYSEITTRQCRNSSFFPILIQIPLQSGE